MIASSTLSIRRLEAETFASRCQAALSAAIAAGDAEWKIEGLREAVTDAEDAAADLRGLGA